MRIQWKEPKIASFKLPGNKFDVLNLNVGDSYLTINAPQPGYQDRVIKSKCTVTKKLEGSIFEVELEHRIPEKTKSAVVEILPLPLRVPFTRMEEGLKRFRDDKKFEAVSRKVTKNLLVEPDYTSVANGLTRLIDMKGLTRLNKKQKQGIKAGITQPITLIQGPPGTGKTVVSTVILYQWVKRANKPILACAPSNVTTDMLAEKLDAMGLKVARVESRARERLEITSTNYKLKSLLSKHHDNKILKRLFEKQSNGERLSRKQKKQLRQLVLIEEEKILQNVDVIVCTLSVSNDIRLLSWKFDQILIDEAAQCTEPEAMMAISHGAKQVALVSDHKQLPPTVLDSSISSIL